MSFGSLPFQMEIKHQLEKKYKSKSEVVKAARGFLSRASVYSFFSKLESGSRASPHVTGILSFFVNGNIPIVYHMLSALSQNQNPGTEVKEIEERFCGKYRYYRYFQELNEPNLKYVDGTLTISVDNGIPSFQHQSHHKKEVVENNGIVLFNGGRIYMLGWRKGVLRLSIAVPTKDEVKQPTYGVVLSVRDVRNDPFAARFLLVREDSKLNELLGSQVKFIPNEETPEIDRFVETVGEYNFRKFWKQDVYFMLGFLR